MAANHVMGRTSAVEYDQMQWLLLSRFGLVNFSFLVALLWVFNLGWIYPLIEADITYIVRLLALIFLYGLWIATVRAYSIAKDLNAVKAGSTCASDYSPHTWEFISGIVKHPSDFDRLAHLYRVKLGSRYRVITYTSVALLTWGLIGTVAGLMIALVGTDEVVSSAQIDPAKVLTMLAGFMKGISVALHTTIVGSVLGLWTSLNLWMVSSCSTRLYTSVLEKGMNHG